MLLSQISSLRHMVPVIKSLSASHCLTGLYARKKGSWTLGARDFLANEPWRRDPTTGRLRANPADAKSY